MTETTERLNRKQMKMARRASRRGAVIDLAQYKERYTPQLQKVSPLTRSQHVAFKAFEAGKNVVQAGCAGTGKTFVSMYLALRDERTVTIVRSAVPVRDMGFVPGDNNEKASIYKPPYRGICAKLYGRADAFDYLEREGRIEFVTTSYIQGMTLDDRVVIVDEFENLNAHELDITISRLGDNSTMLLAGDFIQTSFTKDREKSGSREFVKVLEAMPEFFEIIEYGHEDIVRGEMMKNYIITRDRMHLQVI